LSKKERNSDFITDKELNQRISRLVQFCGKELADIVGDMIEEKQEKLKENHATPPQEMVTNIMAMTMQFTHLLNKETLNILGEAIKLDPNSGMEFGAIVDKKDIDWRKQFKDESD